MNTRCTYRLESGSYCGRSVVADYVAPDPIRGPQLIASLCRLHHRPAAQTEAQSRGYSWVERGELPLVMNP